MMHRPLLVSGIIEHAAAQFGAVEAVSRETRGPLFRYTYAQCAARVANWWLPDEVLFLDSLPVGGTGKVQKSELRQRYGGVFAS
jgi:acyl-CoA synthetase (AMP-forming)/AMP-acid ligase II